MKNIIKKLLLAFSIGLFVGLGVLISYAVNRTYLLEPINSDDILTSTWYNDLRTRIINIYSTGSGGNVGIGTTTPTQKLDVIGNIKATSLIGNVTGNVTGTASHVPWTGVTGRPTNISSFTNDSGYLTSVADNRVNTTGDNITGNFNVSGNVGIGTTTPSQKLQVNGNIRAGIGAYGNIILDDDESPNGIKYIHANSNNIGFLSGSGSWLSRWDNAGNMVNTAGITAGGTIIANGGISDTAGVRMDDAGGWFRTYGTTGWYSQTYGGGWHMTDTSWIRAYNGKSLRMALGLIGGDGGLSIGYASSPSPLGGAIVAGNVGIGTPSPTQKLDVRGSIRSNMLKFGEGANSGQSPDYYGIYQEAGAWSSPYPNLRISYHTGLKYDAYRGYGGHRFYTHYDGSGNPSGLVMQITDKVRVLEGGIEFPNGTVQTTAAGTPATTTVSVLTSNCITKSAVGYPDSVVTCDAGYQATGGGTWRPGNGCDYVGTAPSGNGWKGRFEPCSSTSYVICCQTQTIKVIP